MSLDDTSEGDAAPKTTLHFPKRQVLWGLEERNFRPAGEWERREEAPTIKVSAARLGLTNGQTRRM